VLKKSRLGSERHYFARLDSTSVKLAELARQGAAEGTLLVADCQTAGRGRLARAWYSPPARNIYASLLLRPDIELCRVPQLTLLAGLAMRDTIQALAPEAVVQVKWPNDVRCGPRKICGVLGEMAAEKEREAYVILGLGVNVNMRAAEFPAELRKTATSLYIETGRRHSRRQILEGFLHRFETDYARWLAAGDLGPFLERWQAASALHGAQVEVIQGESKVYGLAAGLSPEGELLLEQSDGAVIRICSGDAHVRLPGRQ